MLVGYILDFCRFLQRNSRQIASHEAQTSSERSSVLISIIKEVSYLM